MTVGERVAAEALTWEGTPFRWQASVKHVGADCKGMVAGVARELGLPEAASLYARKADYRRGMVDSVLLVEGLAALFDRVPAGGPLGPGDVLALCLAGVKPDHLAIVVDGETAMVAIAPSLKVMRRSLRVLLRARMLHSAWRWREAGRVE